MLLCLNRTIMELKSDNIKGIKGLGESLNRTIMELKSIIAVDSTEQHMS